MFFKTAAKIRPNVTVKRTLRADILCLYDPRLAYKFVEMVYFLSGFFSIAGGGLWYFWRRKRLEAIWITGFVASLFSYLGDRLTPNSFVQVLHWTDLWSTALPFAILVAILLGFSLRMSHSGFFNSTGLKMQTWKVALFAPLGAVLMTVPAVDVLNRSTDLSTVKIVETVVQNKTSGVFCLLQIKNTFQDGDIWTLRAPTEFCQRVRDGITPVRLALREGRFGIPYLESIDISKL